MKISVLITFFLAAPSFFGFANAQTTGDERLRLQQWEADARYARTLQIFGTCADDDPQTVIRSCSRQLRSAQSRGLGATSVGLQSGGADFRDGSRLHFTNAIRYVLRANAYARRGDTSRAFGDYDRAVRSANSAGALARDNIFWIHERRAEAYFFAGEYDEALESYDTASQINLGSANILNYRTLQLAAVFGEEFRDPPQALVYAQRLNELMPDTPDFVSALAIAYAANGGFDRAAMEQQRAINLVVDGDQRKIDAYRRRFEIFNEGNTIRMVPRIGLLDVESIRLLDVESVDLLDLDATE